MEFKNWFYESSLKDLLKNVPQNRAYHSEGSVWNHTRMVRKSLDQAIGLMQKEMADPNSPFSNFSPITQDDRKLLKAASWLHDIGKASSTTYNQPNKSIPISQLKNKYTVQQMMSPEWQPEEGPGKIQSIGHEDPEHFEPMMQKLSGPWKDMYEKISPQDKEDLWFIIQNHMGFHDTIPKKLRNLLIDPDGKYKSDRRIKLLLILKFMDSLGRGNGQVECQKLIDDLKQAATKIKPIQQSVKLPESPEEVVTFLQSKGKSQNIIRQALQGKFPQLSQQEINNYLPTGL